MAVRRKKVTPRKAAPTARKPAGGRKTAPRKPVPRRKPAVRKKPVARRKRAAAPARATAPALGLHNLAPAPGSRRRPRRIGRGPGSGTGKTAGRGSKGQLSRSGYSRRRGFEGGQMPLHRRVPKRGFNSPNKEIFAIVNLNRLEAFSKDEEVTPERLVEKGMVKKAGRAVKILGNGELKAPLRIRAHRFSRQAIAKIEKAGGKAEVISR